jgi:hypothetical protein
LRLRKNALKTDRPGFQRSPYSQKNMALASKLLAIRARQAQAEFIAAFDATTPKRFFNRSFGDVREL